MTLESESEVSKQARRVLGIIKLIGANYQMSSVDLVEALGEEFEPVTLRSVQRDLKVVSDAGFIERVREGKNTFWRLVKYSPIENRQSIIRTNELLSFYMLKAFINTFKGTSIAKDLDELSKKLEAMAPGDVFPEEQFYGDQNIGYYDYSDKHEILRLCVRHINEENWIKITYEKLTDDTVNEYILFPQFLYTYSGTLYLIAYNPQRKISTNFAVQNIKSIEEHFNLLKRAPKFDYEVFRRARFAVNDGTLHDIKLTVKKGFVKYFENRTWHLSQKIKYNNNGSYEIKMKVPISNDLLSWLTRWCQAFESIEPEILKQKVIKILEDCCSDLKI